MSDWWRVSMLLYQDFNEQFEGYTQQAIGSKESATCCFIRISMSNLKDIHNLAAIGSCRYHVALSGFQWAIWRIYTTPRLPRCKYILLLYQDFNEQFEGYTQQFGNFGTSSVVALSGFQWAIWRIYTTYSYNFRWLFLLLYQDFNEQFEGYTQRMSMPIISRIVALLGFQWTIWRIYTTVVRKSERQAALFYQDFNEQSRT